jgi:hypothetical protein
MMILENLPWCEDWQTVQVWGQLKLFAGLAVSCLVALTSRPGFLCQGRKKMTVCTVSLFLSLSAVHVIHKQGPSSWLAWKISSNFDAVVNKFPLKSSR